MTLSAIIYVANILFLLLKEISVIIQKVNIHLKATKPLSFVTSPIIKCFTIFAKHCRNTKKYSYHELLEISCW